MAGLQWTVNAFTLALSALILLGGALGDRFGRRRVYLVGMVWFGIASLLCGVAPNLEWLIVARALQGIGGALIVPGSLALIQGSFHRDDRNRAVGWWAGMSGVAGAAGPLLGGGLVDAAGWRWVFYINVPLAVVLGVLLVMHVPESRGVERARGFDVAGAVLAAIALAGLAYALTETSNAEVAMSVGLIGLAVFAAFLVVEHRSSAPMMPLGLFRSRAFSVANLGSFFAYGGLAGVFFLLPIQLQITAGYTPFASGLALLPLTALTLVLSPYGGQLTSRYGARLPLVVGSSTCAVSLLLAIRIDESTTYLMHVLPVVALVGRRDPAGHAADHVDGAGCRPGQSSRHRERSEQRRRQGGGPGGGRRLAAAGRAPAERHRGPGRAGSRLCRQHADLFRHVPRQAASLPGSVCLEAPR